LDQPGRLILWRPLHLSRPRRRLRPQRPAPLSDLLRQSILSDRSHRLYRWRPLNLSLQQRRLRL